jgi:sec-independent protein translocase protein TatB
MLPSLGFQEIVLLAVLALVVVGPKDLPLLLRKLGRWTAKLRAMAQEFRTGFDELARQAELDELKKEVEALRRDQTLREVEHEITRPALAYDSGSPAAPAGSPVAQDEAAGGDPFAEVLPEDSRQPTEPRTGGGADEPLSAGSAR